MHLTIGDDWHILLRKAYSLRFLEVAFLFNALEAMLPIIGYAIPGGPLVQAGVTGALVGAAYVSRFIVQQELDGHANQA